MTQHFHEIECAGCDWSTSPVIGSIEDLASQLVVTIGAHVDGTGHTVHATVSTFGALSADSVEQTAVLFSPRPGGGQPAGRLELKASENSEPEPTPAPKPQVEPQLELKASENSEPEPTPAESATPTAAHVGNNSGDNEWYTPREYIKAAREVMGAAAAGRKVGGGHHRASPARPQGQGTASVPAWVDAGADRRDSWCYPAAGQQ